MDRGKIIPARMFDQIMITDQVKVEHGQVYITLLELRKLYESFEDLLYWEKGVD